MAQYYVKCFVGKYHCFEVTLLLLSTANYLKSNAASLAAGNFAHALSLHSLLRHLKD